MHSASLDSFVLNIKASTWDLLVNLQSWSRCVEAHLTRTNRPHPLHSLTTPCNVVGNLTTF